MLGGYGSGRCKGTANEQWGNLEAGDRGPGTEPTDWEATACMPNGTDGYAIVKQK